MGKKELKNIPDDIKKRMIMMGILAGRTPPVVHQRITLNNSKIENNISFNRELVDLLDIEPDIQEYLNQTRDAHCKLTSNILKKFQEMADSIGCNIVEEGKWPDKPTSFKIDLEDNDD